jgi:hypothetical protein
MGWKCDLDGRVLTLQILRPEFKPHPSKKRRYKHKGIKKWLTYKKGSILA